MEFRPDRRSRSTGPGNGKRAYARAGPHPLVQTQLRKAALPARAPGHLKYGHPEEVPRQPARLRIVQRLGDLGTQLAKHAQAARVRNKEQVAKNEGRECPRPMPHPVVGHDMQRDAEASLAWRAPSRQERCLHRRLGQPRRRVDAVRQMRPTSWNCVIPWPLGWQRDAGRGGIGFAASAKQRPAQPRRVLAGGVSHSAIGPSLPRQPPEAYKPVSRTPTRAASATPPLACCVASAAFAAIFAAGRHCADSATGRHRIGQGEILPWVSLPGLRRRAQAQTEPTSL